MCVSGGEGEKNLPQGHGPSRNMNGKGIVPEVPFDVGWRPIFGRLIKDVSHVHGNVRHWHILHGHGGRRKDSLLQETLCVYIVNQFFPAGNILTIRMSGHPEIAGMVHSSTKGLHCNRLPKK